MTPLIAFNTANLVARVSGYRFQLSNWGEQHVKTVAQTDEKEFAAICREIAHCGYTAVELWVAHVDPERMTEQRAATYRATLAEFGLAPVALAGGLDQGTARVCTSLGIPAVAGGLHQPTKTAIRDLSRQTGIRVYHENHPEKTVEEIRQKIDYGADGLGIAVDTGWMGTQGMDVPAAIRELGTLVRHVHVKDVAAPGGHHTVKLGDGCVNIPGVIRELKAIGYSGALSWEDEPEERNPFDIACEMRLYLTKLWNA
ncbi:MAG: sugar phosphate isomerase/epimerase family protein [Phycisphaeraceae bacterium]